MWNRKPTFSITLIGRGLHSDAAHTRGTLCQVAEVTVQLLTWMVTFFNIWASTHAAIG
jgi:hypothetical protein